ncbi:F-box/kelch-repeat protein At3g06240-like [Henckelia pumila]|uniref:F-box/kelch-repeat protein At3g06240-like n=1 Tax=Henckelia pumila TaxID=405737 RepID=UPI003C6E6213
MTDQRLPTDVLIEVLILLPAKSILKFRCVSKTWRDLIGSPIFIHRHHNRAIKQRILLVKQFLPPENVANYSSLCLSHLYDPNWNQLEIHSYGHLQIVSHSLSPQNPECFHEREHYFNKLLASPHMSIPLLNYLSNPCNLMSNIPIHGPCNGLVCIVVEKTVVLCNPALREFKLLPPLQFPLEVIAIPLTWIWVRPCYCFFAVSPGSKIRFDLYNSASNSWKQLDAKSPATSWFPGYELLYNGAIHWIAIYRPYYSSPSMIVFDVNRETFRQINFHDKFYPSKGDLSLMELNGSLAVVRYGYPTREPIKTEIWVMKQYGVKESWTKQFVVARCDCNICSFLFLKNELLMVESEDGQLAACPVHEENQFKGLHFFGDHRSMSAILYEESLISLNHVIASDRLI